MSSELPSAGEIRHEFVEANGLRFHVARCGETEGERLALFRKVRELLGAGDLQVRGARLGAFAELNVSIADRILGHLGLQRIEANAGAPGAPVAAQS